MHRPACREPATAGPASIDYEALYDAVKDRKLRVDKVKEQLDGHNGTPPRTRKELVDRELQPLYKAETLAELHQAMDAAGQRLAALGVFSTVALLAHEEPSVGPTLHLLARTSRRQPSLGRPRACRVLCVLSTPFARPLQGDADACSVDVSLEESNWLKLRAATYVQAGTNEQTVEFGLGLDNVTGRAEHIRANLDYGMQTSHTAVLSYSIPRLVGLPGVVRGRETAPSAQPACPRAQQVLPVCEAVHPRVGQCTCAVHPRVGHVWRLG
jgi:outer membrane protein insertion porin family